MTTCQDVAKVTGQRLIFLGVNTINWTLAQFQQAAKFAFAHKIDSLLVKVADGGGAWYNGLAGWQNIKKTIQAEGVGAIPYTYSYGDAYNALDAEIDLLIEYMRDSGVVVADMEDKWNGQVAWAQHMCSRMLPVTGTFIVSTFGDPNEQAWQGVLQALNPCVNSYMPQQYSNFLASCWAEFGADGAKCIQPTVMIGTDFGPNDPVAITKAAHSEGHTAISIWYYDLTVQNPNVLDQIVAAFPKTATAGPPSPPSQPPHPQEEDVLLQLTDPLGKYFKANPDGSWTCTQNKVVLKGAMLVYYRMILGACRLPMANEIAIDGYIYQSCESGTMVYDPKTLVDAPPNSHNFTYLLKANSPLAKQLSGYTTLLNQYNQLKATAPTQQVTDLSNKITNLENKISQAIKALS